MAKYLNYKGIIFDDYSKDDNGHYWAEMCQDCFKKYGAVLVDESDDAACGICSVKGCSNSGNSDGVSHYYIDFIDDLITWED